jgi:dipeptidyl aminopeptidase/acylaminoacyl peptidase
MTVAGDTAFDGKKLPLQTLRFTNDGENEKEIEFNANKKRYVCNIDAYTCTVGDTLASDVPFVVSPDKKLEAFIHKHNLWIRDHATKKDSVQLTTDGVEYYSYGGTMPRPSQLQRPTPIRPQLRWSPDSKKIAVTRPDERGVEHMHYLSYTPQRVKHYSQPYALPGDTIVPHPYVHIVDVTTKSNVAAKISPRPNQVSLGGSVRDSAWAPNSQKLNVSYYTRGSKSAYLAEVDAVTGVVRVIARDTGKTFVEIANPQDPGSFYVTNDTKDAFWWSERDGWGHLYRFDGSGVENITSSDGDGGMSNVPTPKAQLTTGAFQVGQIAYVDEVGKQIYFTARGREPGYLYYARLYRMGYDGSGLTLLTPEDANHVISFSPSGKYFVDAYSRIESPPVSVLRAAPDGRVVRKLEEADISRLKSAGWQPGKVFSVKARDGITDIYGVMYLPANLDSTKKYPIIDRTNPTAVGVGAWNFKNGGEQFSLAESNPAADRPPARRCAQGLPRQSTETATTALHIAAITAHAAPVHRRDISLRTFGGGFPRPMRSSYPVLQGRGERRGQPRQPLLQHLLGREVSGAHAEGHAAEDRQLRDVGEQDDGQEPAGKTYADARRHGRQRASGHDSPGDRRAHQGNKSFDMVWAPSGTMD